MLFTNEDRTGMEINTQSDQDLVGRKVGGTLVCHVEEEAETNPKALSLQGRHLWA